MKTASKLTLLALLGATPSVAAASGNAVEFTGTYDYVELGALNPGTSFTIEMWVELDQTNSYRTLLEVVDTSNALNQFYVGYVDGDWQIEIDDTTRTEGDTCAQSGVDTLCQAGSLTTAPTHVAVTVTPTEINLYLDGVLDATQTVTSSPTFGSATWVLGVDTDTAGSYDSDAFDGIMDEVRVWSTAQTGDDIACLRDYALAGVENDLYAYWALDESVGSTTAADSLGGWTGTLGNNAAFVTSPFGLTASSGYDIGCYDYDGDGYTIDDGDCDETDATVNPGASETCGDAIDNDCDGSTDEDDAIDASTWYSDSDGDGYGDAAVTSEACNQPTGAVANSDDCDDSDSAVNPGATEVCDFVDNDCDSSIDEGVTTTWYVDADSDGFGDASNTTEACGTAPSGTVADATDCLDSDGFTYPGAAANDSATACMTDADSDGYGDDSPASGVTAGTDCADSDATINPGATETWYDGIDQDCSGGSDYDRDGDGFNSSAYGGTDCDDTDASIYPGAADAWYDGVDSDCAGNSDFDQDGDGEDASAYGGADCDDTNAAINTSATEVWYDGVDDNCDGNDDDQDGDGYAWDGLGGDDCNDTDASINPGATEVWYDGIDQDCGEDSDYDQDGDGQDAADYGGLDCDDTDDQTYDGAEEIWYDGVDQDCAGDSDYDQDGDGFDSATYGGDDCDDANENTYPGAPDDPYDGEVNDCDGADEYDQDGDGYDAAEYGGDDCDDANSDINPGADEEWYNGVDEDCDGNDDDQDGDGYSVDDDCDDTDPTVAEDCSGDDTGIVDETDTGAGDDDGSDGVNVDTGGLAAGGLTGTYEGGACGGCASEGGAAGGLFLGLLGLLGWRRRRER